MEVVKDAIQVAISQGAPAYNRGRPDLCYEIYRGTAMSLLESGVISSSSASANALRQALDTAAVQDSPDSQAWTMRRAFDSVLDGSCEVVAHLDQALPAGAVDFPVLDLAAGPSGVLPVGAPSWFSMDDVIMGGVSSSRMQYEEENQALVFQGNVTTDSNGGFASVRSSPWAGWSLLGKSLGMRLLVQGDGRVYKVTAKTDNAYDGVQFQHDFHTLPVAELQQQLRTTRTPSFPIPQGWQVVDLPFNSFTPNFRGRPVLNQAPLKGSQIRQLGLMVSKFAAADGGLTPGFRNGSFRLALRSVHGFL